MAPKNIATAKEKLTLLKMAPDKRKGYERYIMDMVVDQDVLRTAIKENTIAIVKNSLRQGLEPTVIASITDLTVEEVQEIANTIYECL